MVGSVLQFINYVSLDQYLLKSESQEVTSIVLNNMLLFIHNEDIQMADAQEFHSCLETSISSLKMIQNHIFKLN